MQVNEALEHHKALLTTRQRTARVTSFVFLALLILVLLVPLSLITWGNYQPDVGMVFLFAFLALTNAIHLGKTLAEIRMYGELIDVLDMLRRIVEATGHTEDIDPAER
jgi:hypothetical protein